MFQHFLQQYKYDVYIIGTPSRWRLLIWKEWLLVALSLFGLIGYPLFFPGNRIYTHLISVVIGIIVFALLFQAINKRVKKERQERFNRYRTKKLKPLVTMLQELEFYNIPKIDWLLQCCDIELKRPQNEQLNLSDVFLKFIFPALSILFGYVIKDIDVNTILILAGLLIMIFILVCSIKVGVIPIVQNLIYPDQNIIQFLESELQYIKSELADKSKINM